MLAIFHVGARRGQDERGRPHRTTRSFLWGDPYKVGELFSSLLAAHDGLDGFPINMIPNRFIEGRVELLGPRSRSPVQLTR